MAFLVLRHQQTHYCLPYVYFRVSARCGRDRSSSIVYQADLNLLLLLVIAWRAMGSEAKVKPRLEHVTSAYVLMIHF